MSIQLHCVFFFVSLRRGGAGPHTHQRCGGNVQPFRSGAPAACLRLRGQLAGGEGLGSLCDGVGRPQLPAPPWQQPRSDLIGNCTKTSFNRIYAWDLARPPELTPVCATTPLSYCSPCRTATSRRASIASTTSTWPAPSTASTPSTTTSLRQRRQHRMDGVSPFGWGDVCVWSAGRRWGRGGRCQHHGKCEADAQAEWRAA